MFHHGYIFQTMLAEAGPLNDGQVREHRTMQLLYGVNRPFKIRLEGKWHRARLCLLDQGIPHYVNGDGDWQYCFYIYPDSHTGYLLQSILLKDAPASLFSQEPSLTGLDIMPSVVRPVSPFDLTRLFERIIFLFTGRQPRPRPEPPFLKELRQNMLRNGAYSARDLAVLSDMDGKALAEQFKRITEFNLETWLLHQRMMQLFDRWEKREGPGEQTIESMARDAGIAGEDGLDRLFKDLFGIPYSRWTGTTVGSVILTDHRVEFPCFL